MSGCRVAIRVATRAAALTLARVSGCRVSILSSGARRALGPQRLSLHVGS
eukprot:COSAG01_NODE_472_length_16538_cov_126.145690_4_plen_50_part_00